MTLITAKSVVRKHRSKLLPRLNVVVKAIEGCRPLKAWDVPWPTREFQRLHSMRILATNPSLRDLCIVVLFARFVPDLRLPNISNKAYPDAMKSISQCRKSIGSSFCMLCLQRKHSPQNCYLSNPNKLDYD